MNAEMDCEQVRELAPELAIGIADGKQRDAALRHAATCPDCRQLVAELSTVVDDLLLLAPSHEPPPGFASRTVARICPPTAPRRRATRPAAPHIPAARRWLPRLAVAASVAAALAAGAGAVYQGTASDRQLADSYRSVLAQGHGSFFAAAPLRGPAGTVGTVYGYQGRPSWLFATMQLPNPGPQRFDVQLITRDGRHLSAGSAVLGGTHGTWGAQIPIDLTNLAQLRFVGHGGQTTMVAYLNTRAPGGPADEPPRAANPEAPAGRRAREDLDPRADRRAAVANAPAPAPAPDPGRDSGERLMPGGARPAAARRPQRSRMGQSGRRW